MKDPSYFAFNSGFFFTTITALFLQFAVHAFECKNPIHIVDLVTFSQCATLRPHVLFRGKLKTLLYCLALNPYNHLLSIHAFLDLVF